MSDALPQIAARVWQDREAAAAAQVRSGNWTQAEADKRLRPWLAICLLAGVTLRNLPTDVAADVETLRKPVVFCKGDGSPPDYNHTHPEDFAREYAAMDLAPPRVWAPELAEALQRAIDRHAKAPTDQNARQMTDLAAIAKALDVTAPYRPAAPQGLAA